MSYELRQETTERIKTFRDLFAWQEGHKLVLMTYTSVEKFPLSERFGLSDQMRRAAVSITSNLARRIFKRTPSDKSHFYHISLGSLTELENQILIAKDLGLIENQNAQVFAEKVIVVSKLINGLIKATRSSIRR